MSTKTAPLDRRAGRRRRAWEMKEAGWKQQDIAAALGVTPRGREPMAQARARAGRQGVAAPPRARSLSQAHRHAPGPASRPAGARGGGVRLRGQAWTCRRVAEDLRRTFGVAYHPAHVSRLLHALRQSVQRLVARAAQRDEAAIAAWWRERWPAVEKSRRGRADRRRGRLVRLLSPAAGGPHLGAVRAGAARARAADP
jgi:transposase